jgi:hypothetical protein
MTNSFKWKKVNWGFFRDLMVLATLLNLMGLLFFLIIGELTLSAALGITFFVYFFALKFFSIGVVVDYLWDMRVWKKKGSQ